MENRIYGYARVSSREQNTDRQIEALTKFGVPEQQIIIDRASGKDTEREGYQYLKRQILRSGDTLSGIAKKYGTTVKKLCALNGIKESKILQIGQKIRVR